MFDIGFLELLVIAVLSLLVLGPERLPGAVKTASLWISRIRRSFQQVKLEIEREINISEIKQQIHNESIMETLQKTKTDIENDIQKGRDTLQKELGSDSYNLSDTFDSPHEPAASTDDMPAKPHRDTDQS